MPDRGSPRDGLEVDVFVSYARTDRDVVDSVAALLRAAGCEVWWDKLLTPGEIFDEKIEQVVGTAKVIVGVLSPSSMASDWVRWELSQAITNGLHVIPLLVGGLEPEDLAPPLALVHCLVVPEVEAAALEECAMEIRRAVEAVRQRNPRLRQRDRVARRRLALAATDTARRAREIKRKNQGPAFVDRRGVAPEQPGHLASPGLAELLRANAISLAITSPDGDRLILVGTDPDGGLSVADAAFEGPTGLCWRNGRLTVAARTALHSLENVLRPEQRYDGRFSHCFLARRSHFVGDLGLHDVAASADQTFFVSSRYSCVAIESAIHSFQLAWKPGFVTRIAAEDRCHLNGLALRHGEPAYATAFGESDVIDGWRDEVHGGGVVLDIGAGEVVCRGLTMPHSPRLHDGRLWVLDSGSGALGVVQPTSGVFESVAFLPGFARGLALVGDLAFVGVSRPRYESFDGLELDDRLDRTGAEARTGVAVVDIDSGRCIEWLWLVDDTREVYDVAALRGVGCAVALTADAEEALGLITMEDGGS